MLGYIVCLAFMVVFAVTMDPAFAIISALFLIAVKIGELPKAIPTETIKMLGALTKYMSDKKNIKRQTRNKHSLL